MKDRLGIEFISAMAMPPVDFVELAADLGVSRIGIAASAVTDNPEGFAAWSLSGNAALVRETKRALAEHGVMVALGEGFLLLPGRAIDDAAAELDIMAELGAPRVNSVVIESDRARAFDEFGRFVELARERGMRATLEFLPLTWPASLDEALEFISESGVSDGQLLVDTMHLFRSGGTVEDIRRLDPELIGHVQICDVPMPARDPDYGEEARHERLCPGEGDLPLAEFVAALPADVTIGLEVPMFGKAAAGIDARTRLGPCVSAARSLLGQAA